ncbi:uncharacterized protein LOC132746736 [Ruditapes philippinarum]|uniref:uncharacterized protein LOC132746736 n=1 Tax=Ruditapes philippinarum TaxID=129788 RepID=UPI00295A717B|nr:uncharacterized protein LOC132746736 [Ruditapes philippinarum]
MVGVLQSLAVLCIFTSLVIMEQSCDQIVFDIMNIARIIFFLTISCGHGCLILIRRFYMQTQATKDNSSGRFEKLLSSDETEIQCPIIQRKTTTGQCTAGGSWLKTATYNRRLSKSLVILFPIKQSSSVHVQKMDFWSQQFICEIERKNGEFYPPTTLLNIAARLKGYLRNEESMHVNFVKTEDSFFLTSQNIGSTHARVVYNEGIWVEVNC